MSGGGSVSYISLYGTRERKLWGRDKLCNKQRFTSGQIYTADYLFVNLFNSDIYRLLSQRCDQ